MLFLYFLVLFTFYAGKKDTNTISNRHKTKTNIAVKKFLGKSKDRYIYANTMQRLMTLSLFKAEPYCYKTQKKTKRPEQGQY